MPSSKEHWDSLIKAVELALQVFLSWNSVYNVSILCLFVDDLISAPIKPCAYFPVFLSCPHSFFFSYSLFMFSAFFIKFIFLGKTCQFS